MNTMAHDLAQGRESLRNLKEKLFVAMDRLGDRELQARQQGDDTLGDELSSAQRRIEQRLMVLDAAETELLLSPQNIADVIRRLRDAERTADGALTMMKSVKNALKGAKMVLNLLTRLWQLAA